MVDIDEAVKLKKTIKKMEREKDKAQGRVEQLLTTLEEDFDCNTLEEAEELLEEKERKQKQLEKKYNTKLKSFKKKYGEKLAEIDG